VRLSDGRLHYRRETGRLNARNCWDFLRSLRRACRNRRRRVVVIVDNAKFHDALMHKAWREKMAPGFHLDFLPPCSPELNPIERVWKLTRRLCLHDRYFPVLSELIGDVEDQFDEWRHGILETEELCQSPERLPYSQRSHPCSTTSQALADAVVLRFQTRVRCSVVGGADHEAWKHPGLLSAKLRATIVCRYVNRSLAVRVIKRLGSAP
jgi:transposase